MFENPTVRLKVVSVLQSDDNPNPYQAYSNLLTEQITI